MCLRGIAVTGSMTVASEVSDFPRFPTAPKFMDYVGLTVSEHGSGKETRRGSSTKAGSSNCRHVLVQTAWALVRTSSRLRAQWERQPPWVIALAQKAMKRLHQRYWHLVHRGKLPQVAITAVAREIAGFVWAIMQDGPTPKRQKAA